MGNCINCIINSDDIYEPEMNKNLLADSDEFDISIIISEVTPMSSIIPTLIPSTPFRAYVDN